MNQFTNEQIITSKCYLIQFCIISRLLREFCSSTISVPNSALNCENDKKVAPKNLNVFKNSDLNSIERTSSFLGSHASAKSHVEQLAQALKQDVRMNIPHEEADFSVLAEHNEVSGRPLG